MTTLPLTPSDLTLLVRALEHYSLRTNTTSNDRSEARDLFFRIAVAKRATGAQTHPAASPVHVRYDGKPATVRDPIMHPDGRPEWTGVGHHIVALHPTAGEGEV